MTKVTAKWFVGLSILLAACENRRSYCDQPLRCDSPDGGNGATSATTENSSDEEPALGATSDAPKDGPAASSGGESATLQEATLQEATEAVVQEATSMATVLTDVGIPPGDSVSDAGGGESESAINEDATTHELPETDEVPDVDSLGPDGDFREGQSGGDLQSGVVTTDGGGGIADDASTPTESVIPTQAVPEDAVPTAPTSPPLEVVDSCSSSGTRGCRDNVAFECQSGVWTEVETCIAGCTGAGVCTDLCESVTCDAPMCKLEGMCEPATGSCSTPTNAPNGWDCDDSNPCTKVDACISGECVGSPIACDEPPACKEPTTCSEGTCDYSQNVPDGTNDLKCTTGTQYCSSGACVECASDEQCSGSTPSCRPLDHTCTCRLPSSGNLLVNPGFDGSLVGWKNTGPCTQKPDSEGCSGSKSVGVSSSCQMEQCIQVSNGPYVIGARFKQDARSGKDCSFRVIYYSDDNCTQEVDSIDTLGSATTAWASFTSSVDVPSGISSAKIQTWCLDVLVDQVFFGTTGEF